LLIDVFNLFWNALYSPVQLIFKDCNLRCVVCVECIDTRSDDTDSKEFNAVCILFLENPFRKIRALIGVNCVLDSLTIFDQISQPINGEFKQRQQLHLRLVCLIVKVRKEKALETHRRLKRARHLATNKVAFELFVSNGRENMFVAVSEQGLDR